VKQAPAWNDVAKKFAGNADVVFGDVVLSKNQVNTIHGEDQGAGSGGWPTVRHFNKATGYGGKAYVQKTDQAMCDELGPKTDYMQLHIEEAGGTSLCNPLKVGDSCSDQQKKFITKWADESMDKLQAQVTRLAGMVEKDGASMKPEALTWAKQRLKIVETFHANGGKKEEL